MERKTLHFDEMMMTMTILCQIANYHFIFFLSFKHIFTFLNTDTIYRDKS